MKVLFIIGATPPIPCGVGNQTFHLARNLSENFEAKVVLYTYLNTKILHYTGMSIYFFTQSKIRFYLKLIYILLKERPDVAQISYPNRGFAFEYPYLMSLILRVFTKKTVITFHEVPLKINKFKWYLLTRVPTSYVLVRNQILGYLNLKSHKVITNFSDIPISGLTEQQGEELKYSIAKEKKLCVHFGFISPNRCVEQLFEVLNPTEFHLLLIGNLNEDKYSQMLQKKIWSEKWAGNVTITGYLSAKLIANLLFAADVVILPFVNGAHDANTTTKAATIQGTFLITTSTERNGYDDDYNIYYTTPGNTDEIIYALQRGFSKFPKMIEAEDSIGKITKQYYEIFNTQLP